MLRYGGTAGKAENGVTALVFFALGGFIAAVAKNTVGSAESRKENRPEGERPHRTTPFDN